MEKPISLIIRDTKAELAKICNESQLPAFLLEPIFKELYQEIKHLLNEQLRRDEEEYQKSLIEKETKEVIDEPNNN